MLSRRLIAAWLAAPVLYLGTLFAAAYGAVHFASMRTPQLTCPEAARVMDAASRSNGVHWEGVTCTSIKSTGPHNWEAVLDVDDGGGTIHTWRADYSLDQYIITSAISTGSHTVPKS